MDTTTPTLPHATVAPTRATVALPACARRGCALTAWFVVHHVAVCSLACAEGIAAARELARQRMRGRSHAGTRDQAARVA